MDDNFIDQLAKKYEKGDTKEVDELRETGADKTYEAIMATVKQKEYE